MSTLGTIVALIVAGLAFFTGGVGALRKLPYPYRWVDITFQLTIGSSALLWGAFLLLSLILAPFRHAHP